MSQSAALSLARPLGGARFRILAFPHAGGGASAFTKLRMALASYQVELCALQPPGRENRSGERPHTVIEELALEFADALETLAPLPSAFLGHSMGGLVAYLTARLLAERNGRVPEHLVVSACLSPAERGACQQNTRSLRERILAFGGIPAAIQASPELFDMFQSVIAEDFAMSDAYLHVPAAPLACAITVYSGNDDAAARPARAPQWQRMTQYDLKMRSFVGGHFFLYADPDATARALLEDLGLYRLPSGAVP